jgi:hypothetical protein
MKSYPTIAQARSIATKNLVNGVVSINMWVCRADGIDAKVHFVMTDDGIVIKQGWTAEW